MKVVGSVKPDDVPRGPRVTFGIWTSLATQVIEAHQKGEVLVVTCADRAEYKKMSNGMSEKLRLAGYGRQFTTVNEADGVRVYLQLTDEIPSRNRNGSVAPANRRQRKRAAEPEPEPVFKRIQIGGKRNETGDRRQ